MEQTTAKHNPLTFYLRTLLYMFIALPLRILTFAPLACLFAFPAGSALRYLALLCPLLLIFFLLPLRFSFAEALVQKSHQRWFSFDLALNTSNYGEKLAASLLHALNVFKWGIPLFAMLGYSYYCYSGMDAFTLLRSLETIGVCVADFGTSIANFFITLFGSIHTISFYGGFMEGLMVIAAILGVGVLIWLYGALRNSATRYIWVASTRAGKSPHKEIRRRMRGHRFDQLWQGLINLVLWIPFVFVMLSIVKTVMSDVSSQLMFALAQEKLPVMDLTTALLPLIFCFTFLYFPLLPVRRCLTAFFATRTLRPVSPKASPTPIKETPAAEDMPVAAMEAMPASEPAHSSPLSASFNENSVTDAPLPIFASADARNADVYNDHTHLMFDAQPAQPELSSDPIQTELVDATAQFTAEHNDGEEYEISAEADVPPIQPNFTIGQ